MRLIKPRDKKYQWAVEGEAVNKIGRARDSIYDELEDKIKKIKKIKNDTDINITTKDILEGMKSCVKVIEEIRFNSGRKNTKDFNKALEGLLTSIEDGRKRIIEELVKLQQDIKLIQYYSTIRVQASQYVANNMQNQKGHDQLSDLNRALNTKIDALGIKNDSFQQIASFCTELINLINSLFRTYTVRVRRTKESKNEGKDVANKITDIKNKLQEIKVWYGK